MRLVSLDFSPLQNATNLSADVKSSKNTAKRIGYAQRQIGLTNQSLNLQQRQLDQARQDRMVGYIFKGIEVAGQIGSAVYGMLEQGKDQERKTFEAETRDEVNKAHYQALKDGWAPEVDENGEIKSTIPSSVQKIIENAKAKGAEKFKGFARVQTLYDDYLNKTYDSVSTNLMDKYVLQEAKDYDAKYVKNESAAISDSVTNEDYDAKSALAQVYSNAKLSPEAKEVRADQVKKQVAFGIDVKRIEAVTERMGEAEGIKTYETYSGSYTPEQKKYAEAAIARSEKATTDQVVQRFTDAVVKEYETGKKTIDIDKGVEALLKGYPADRQEKVRAAIQKKYDTRALEYGEKAWTSDRYKGYTELQNARDIIAKDGEFAKSEDARNVFLNRYDNALSDMEKALKSAKKDKSTDLLESAYTLWEGGEYSGEEVVDWLKVKGEDDPKTVNTLIKRINDNLVQDKYKPVFERFTKTVEGSILKAYKASGKTNEERLNSLTTDQKTKLNEAVTWSQGAVIDLLFETRGGKLTDKDFNDKMGSIINTYTAKELDVLRTGTVSESYGFLGFGKVTSIDDALSKNTLMQAMDPVYLDRKGNLNWASAEIKSTYDTMEGVFKAELEKNGIVLNKSLAEKGVISTPMQQGKYDVIPQHVFTSEDGKKYSWFGKSLMVSEDGESWKMFTKPTMTKEEQTVSTTAAQKGVGIKEAKEINAAQKAKTEQAQWEKEQEERNKKGSGILGRIKK
jgi:hypothetical protein